MANQKRILLAGAVLLGCQLGCQAEISGRLPSFNGDLGNFDIVYAGSVPRRITIAANEPFKANGVGLDQETARQAALEFVTGNSAFFRGQGAELRVDEVAIDGVHNRVSFGQMVNGLPVFDAGMEVFFTDAFQLEMVHNRLVPGLSAPALGGEISGEQAVAAALSTLPAGAVVASAPAPVHGYEVVDGAARLSYRVRLTTEEPDRAELVTVDALSGEVLQVKDLLVDVTAQGNVFPRSNRFYSAPDQVSFDVDTSGFLRSSTVDVQVGQGARASSSSADFRFGVSDPRFGEVNTFFHLSSLVTFLRQNGINAITERFPVRVRGIPEVNAFYDPSRQRITIGAGQGIDLSFDGDVVAHEFGHALLDRIRPGLIGSGPEAGAIHEAFGDTLAMYFFGNPDLTEGFALDIMTKMGPGAFQAICPGFEFNAARPFCRTGDNRLHYPEDLLGEVHFDSMIVSAPLWKIFEAMTAAEGEEAGRARALKTLARGVAFLPAGNARFTDLLAGMVEADRALSGGRYRSEIVGAFNEHGINRPDILQCSANSDCDGGDRCNAGFCDGGDPQPVACIESTGCSGDGMACQGGMCVPEDGGVFFLELEAGELPTAIPDNNPAGASARIEVPVDVTIKKLSARVKITHPFSGDLTVSLLTPAGRVIVLQDREGASANDVNRTYEIIGLEGQSGQGTWVLQVIDRAAQDAGTLESFSLSFN